MRFKLVLVVLGIFAITGCTTPLLMVSSSTPPNGRAFEVLGPTEGESCYENILGIPLSRDASLNTAVKEAKLKLNAEALVDVVVDSWSLYTFFYNKQCTIVHANGIRFTGQPAPYLEPQPAVPPVPPKKEEAAPPPPPKEEAKAKTPAKPAEKKKSKRELARERRKAERERKKAEREAKKQAALDKKRQAEEEKKRQAEEKRQAAEAKKKAEEEKKRQAEIAKQKALEKRRAEEESKPIPDQYKVFCKYKKGEYIRVETKTQVIEAEFVKCVYFGVRVDQKEKGIGVIPFDQIWMVKKIVPPPQKTEPAKPASPKKPAAPKTPAKPAKP
jgi:chemotaxis protein histidine kinase CheA